MVGEMATCWAERTHPPIYLSNRHNDDTRSEGGLEDLSLIMMLDVEESFGGASERVGSPLENGNTFLATPNKIGQEP